MKIVQLLFLLILGVACIIVAMDKDESEKETVSGNVTGNSDRTPPPAPAEKFPADSLVGKLNPLSLKFSRYEIFSLCSSLAEKEISDMEKAKTYLTKIEPILKSFRELDKCSEFGFKRVGDPRQGISHAGHIYFAVNTLLISAEYQFRKGNKKQALKDLETAQHINTFLFKNITTTSEIFFFQRNAKNIVATADRCQVPHKLKQQILNELPDRKDYIAKLKTMFDFEKESLLFSREWAEELEQEQFGKNYQYKSTDYDRNWKKIYAAMKQLKKIPAERVVKIYDDYAEFITKRLSAPSTHENIEYTFGTPEEDKILKELVPLGKPLVETINSAVSLKSGALK